MEVRFNPANLMESTRAVVVCALNYKNSYSLDPQGFSRPRIASYALAPDYHKVVRKMLKSLLRELQVSNPALRGRSCVDTAPLLEKQLAYEAGLGWIGRQSLLVTPQFGSFVVLGVLLLDQEVDAIDSPFEGEGCGQCRRCVDACPTKAILPTRMIDTRRCISAQSVECSEPQIDNLHGWIFGCEECQSCCPYNRATPMAAATVIAPILTPPTAEQWGAMSSDEFLKIAGATPLRRGGIERIERNLALLKPER